VNVSDTPSVLARGTRRETQRIRRILRRESTGGILLIIAAAAALLVANLAPVFYAELIHTHLGGTVFGLNLDLSLAHWAAEGLLAVFFFMVGLELKREFVAGDLSSPKTALVPVAAAVGGVAVPAAIYTAFTFGDPVAVQGWAIPAATDIAFALAVLAVISSHLPTALRTFLLTLAVADDLIAILIIAFFYSSGLVPLFLAWDILPVVAFWIIANKAQHFLAHHWWAPWVTLFPLAAISWALVYNSGVHATIAGVILAFCIPVRPASGDDDDHGLAEIFEHRIRPFSAGVAVPVFAFFSAGVTLGGWEGFLSAVTSPIGLGVILGLVAGKAIGITGATWLVTRLRHASLDPALAWIDVFGLAVLGGIGFTVSLLISELSFTEVLLQEHAKVAVLTASVIAALLASLILGLRNKRYRAVEEAEQAEEAAADPS
jgi:NhaA family Na+:H+ antiporter